MGSAATGMDMTQGLDNQGGGDDGNRASNDSWESRARSYGLQPDQIDEMRRDVQRDITRARQKDRGDIQRLEQGFNELRAAVTQGNGQRNGTQDKVEPLYARELARHGVTKEKAPDLYAALVASHEAAITEAVNRTAQSLAPHLGQVTEFQRNSALGNEINRLKERFGKDVDRYLPDIERSAKDILARGGGIRKIEDVFEDIDPEAYSDCVYRERHRKLSQRQAKANNTSPEGFQQVRRQNPIDTGSFRQTDQPDKEILSGTDLDRITNEALAAAGIRTA